MSGGYVDLPEAPVLEESACERCSCGGTRVGFDAHCDRCGAV